MQFGTVQTICGHCGKLAYTSIGFCQLCGHIVQAQAAFDPSKRTFDSWEDQLSDLIAA